MEIQARITRAIKAKEVLENEIYIESFELVKQEILTSWSESPARDTQARETLYLMLKLTEKLKATMQVAMETGKLAELDLKHQQTMLDRAKSLVTSRW